MTDPEKRTSSGLWIRLLLLMLVLSLVGNAYLVLRNIPITDGGGVCDVSPDGSYYGHAGSKRNLNPLAGERDVVYGRLTVERNGQSSPGQGTVLIEVMIRPAQVEHEAEYREKAKVAFSADSRTVTFDLPSGTYKLNVPEEKSSL
jgi:hypothetical protein